MEEPANYCPCAGSRNTVKSEKKKKRNKSNIFRTTTELLEELAVNRTTFTLHEL